MSDAKQAVEPIAVGSKQAAEILGISERTLWTLTDAGEIPCIRYSATGAKRVTKLYRVADLRAWADAKAEEGRR
jgi:predicted site-specific integrase-resolvase